MEKEMPTHSSTLAWKITRTEEPGGLHGVAKSQTWLIDFTFTFHFHALEKEMATHSPVLAWRIPGRGEPWGLPFMGSQSQTRLKWLSSLAAAVDFNGGENGNQLQYSCLENPRDGGAWWAAVYGVTQSRTRLRQLSSSSSSSKRLL